MSDFVCCCFVITLQIDSINSSGYCITDVIIFPIFHIPDPVCEPAYQQYECCCTTIHLWLRDLSQFYIEFSKIFILPLQSGRVTSRVWTGQKEIPKRYLHTCLLLYRVHTYRCCQSNCWHLRFSCDCWVCALYMLSSSLSFISSLFLYVYISQMCRFVCVCGG